MTDLEKRLAEALFWSCYQNYAISEDSDVCYHRYMSDGEVSLALLAELGYASTDDGVYYTLNANKMLEDSEKWFL